MISVSGRECGYDFQLENDEGTSKLMIMFYFLN